MTQPITRRSFLCTLGLAVPFLVVAPSALGQVSGRARRWFRFSRAIPSETVFGLSVASGDPSPSGVVLWTRINPRTWRSDRPLAFEVAADPDFRVPVVRGLVEAERITAATDFTVRIDLDGQLPSGRVHYYRFIYRGVASRTGRCRTLPLPGSPVERVKLAVLTCQDFANGYYGALARVAGDEDIDFVVHLGDFIYEGAADPARQALPYPDRFLALPSGQAVAVDLDDFRYIYQRYRSDRFFQEAMERHTWMIIWDDHETANDTYWDYARDTLGAPDHPFTRATPDGGDPDRLRRLKRDAMQAWAEYVPARLAINEAALHPHGYYAIYRSFVFGDLLQLFMLDERTYRTPHPCGEGGFGERQLAPDCPGRTDPAGTMLGAAQADWLIDGLTHSPAIWKALGNQVLFAELAVGDPETGRTYLSVDAWDGFEAERRRVADAVHAAGVRDLVWLTGDLHSYIASYVKRDYRDRANDDPDNVIGVEFMTPAVTSSNLVEIARGPASGGAEAAGLAGMPERFLFEPVVRAANPHIQFFNSQDWGYATVEFNRWYCEYTAYAVDKSVNRRDAARRTLKRLRVPRGWPRLLDVSV